MNHMLSIFFSLLFIIISQTAFSRTITSIEDASLGGGNTITFDNIPFGYLRDSYADDTINIDGVSFSQRSVSENGLTFPLHSLTIDGVTFSNGGALTYPFPDFDEGPFFAIDELAIRGEGNWLSGTSDISENHILVQRPRNIEGLDPITGPDNTIQISFDRPVTAFSLEFGGNQSPGSQSVDVYNTNDELVASFPTSLMGWGYSGSTQFYGYSIDSDSDSKISYIKCGNLGTADSIWINDLTYTNRTVFFANWLRDRRLWLISLLIIPAAIYIYRRIRRRNIINRL